MIQQSPGCDNPDQSVFQGSRSPETVDGPSEGSLKERGEEEKEKEGREEEEEEGEEKLWRV